jgi:hypothetical protein
MGGQVSACFNALEPETTAKQLEHQKTQKLLGYIITQSAFTTAFRINLTRLEAAFGCVPSRIHAAHFADDPMLTRARAALRAARLLPKARIADVSKALRTGSAVPLTEDIISQLKECLLNLALNFFEKRGNLSWHTLYLVRNLLYI